MAIGGILQNHFMEGMRTGAAVQKAGGSSKQFGQRINQAAGVKTGGYKVYMKTDDMLYSGGNGSGLSFYIKYTEDSTRENPTVIAKGVDENGKEFEQTIRINEINPRNATVVEMHALESYLGVDKSGGLSSLPHDPFRGAMGLNDRADFIDMFQRTLRDMNALGQKKLADYYSYSLQMYWDFMREKGKNGPVLADGNSPFTHWQKHTGRTGQKPAGGQEAKSDSKIITEPDGSRTLMVTTQVGDMQTVMNIRLSEPSVFPQNPAREDIPAGEDGRKDILTGENIRSDILAVGDAGTGRQGDAGQESGKSEK